MRDPLPPAAPPEPRAPRCHHCLTADVLWDRDHPGEFPLSSCNIGTKFICERCALRLAAKQEHLPYHPSAEAVRTLIASKRQLWARP